MILKSLRTSIAINLALLLLVAMLLINFVMLFVVHRILVNVEVSKGRSTLYLLKAVLQAREEIEPIRSFDRQQPWVEQVRKTMAHAGVACFVISGVDTPYITSAERCGANTQLQRLAQDAANGAEGGIATRSSIRDIFWPQNGYILLAEPLKPHGTAGLGAAIMIPLDALLHILKRIQHVFLSYILVNTAILTLLGIYRLNKLTVKPIQRLVRRAEEYRETEDTVFLLEKEDNEFSKLSKSLNGLLLRTSRDKEKLQASVASLKNAKRDLEKAQLELIQAEKLVSVGRLSAGIAHEIGNPIGIIKGYLELLKDPSLPSEDKDEFIGRTEIEVERINAIIRQLLDFARPATDEHAIVAVHMILRELEDLCRRQPLFTSFKFALDLCATKDQIMADGHQLRQVFLNLILNAADAFDGLDSPEENRLTIRTSLAADAASAFGQALVVEFIDNGDGISDENLANIFDPFFTTKEPGRGTGLGLSVSFAIIEGFGGKLQAAANELHGTTMRIRLPLAVVPDAPPTVARKLPP